MPSPAKRNPSQAALDKPFGPDQMTAHVSGLLDEFERLLDTPNPKRSFYKCGIRTSDASIPAQFRARFEELTRRFWASSGSGKGFLEARLLQIHTMSAGLAALPLLRDALYFTRAHDTLSFDRKHHAMECITAIAFHTQDPEAIELLMSLLRHGDMRVRTWAVEFVATVHLRKRGEELTLADECVGALAFVAKNDPAFEPRFRARELLAKAGQWTPSAPDGHVYTFEVSIGKASRTIEMESKQSLDQLASAILRAFNWDSDHLYEFRFSKVFKSHAFKWPHDDTTRVPLFHEADEALDEFGAEDEEPSMTVGFPGFTVSQEFTFLYDFGDNHEFTIRVVDIRDNPDPRAKYPRITKKSGKAPPQYGTWYE